MTPRRLTSHRADPKVAEVAAMIADPVRCAMLFALLDGQELPASALAYRGEALPQAASGHLAKLVDRGLLIARSEGRQRLFRLASSDVGRVMEALAAIARPATIVALDQNTTMQRLRAARSCYDHVAGRLGVAIADNLIERGAIRSVDDAFDVTRRGAKFFQDIGVDLSRARLSRRGFGRACMDWTERRPHVAGSLGAAIRDRFLSAGWIVRGARDRALRVTPEGHCALAERFQIRLQS